jgi:hypothetical protein
MPDMDEIERAWRRPKPAPDPGLDGYKRFITRSTTLAFAIILLVCLGIGASAVADLLLRLGWGYSWRDVWAALAISAVGAMLYGVSRAWFEVTGFSAHSRDRSRPNKRIQP